MKLDILVGRGDQFLFFITIVFFSALVSSCVPENSDLGLDIFPDSDSIYVYTDTITDLDFMIVSSDAIATSLQTSSVETVVTNLLGSLKDSISGTSSAELVTQTSLSSYGIFGTEPAVDSIKFQIYFSDVKGDTLSQMRIYVYELIDTIVYDSVYYSNFDVTGKYNPVPIVDAEIIPAGDSVYTFYISDLDFINKVKAAAADSVFENVAMYKDLFKGYYIKTEPVVSDGGALASVVLGNASSGLSFRYLHDSVDVATADYTDYNVYRTNLHPYFCQRINIFNHDYTGTAIESMIDNPTAKPSYGLVQGMGGVNCKISLAGLEDFIDTLDVKAINGATLIFYIVPDSESGISEDDYPQNLMIVSQLEDGSYENLYDLVLNYTNSTFNFGELSRSNKTSAFEDPVYYYSFNISRHVQAVVSGEIENRDLLLNIGSPKTSSDYIKFWTNYSGMEGGLKLELIYSKF